jgi:hypothetical protein
MFGHFKAEEFLNLIEGASLPAARRQHLDSCAACTERLRSVESVHANLSMLAMTDTDIPEPDWEEFRSSVRTEMLSRSVQRESVVRRWTGWAIRPAMAWGLSMALLMCVMTGGFLWHVSTDRIQQAHEVESEKAAAVAAAAAVDTQDPVLYISSDDMDSDAIETEKTVWADTDSSVFETVAQLEGPQAEQLRQMLETAPQKDETFDQQ